ncbi:hydrogenase iron-sulfur subunit [Thermosulfuriphilus ammonigenes]|uniref:Hydrogenase iron-sulfur subunit n=1 Tax=Thermosulfuriphilus ammonigenes TaxID=1936021 RepID=A0A6G7PT82_9BACT|nr:hydrogenase iron-sulfur subunit [Thermosulfuriphilus ammonigenes]MBA2849275.1 F420-non-reducing hydrogenase iron-sulfur subunit [Thermosulfuriphilus ammonigenes]QIJ70889.1 hydrogenase iron-sulfur subunit [Thermosulfuriphilus ammonigenes]
MNKEKFVPQIIYGLCSWCGSGGSETAGAFRLKYPENVRPFRVMCTGALDPVYVLRALIEGADGFVMSGCHPGDCHYNTGNFRGRRRIAVLKTIFAALGLEAERIWLRWVAHGEGKRLADTAKEFNHHITKIGPNPWKQRWDT